MSRRRIDITQFVDIEAQVDEQEEEEQKSEDEFNHFIDDNHVGDEQEARPWRNYRRDRKLSVDLEEEAAFLEDLAEGVRRRAHTNRNTNTSTSEEYCILSSGILLAPSPADKGLWRVSCWPGYEYDAVCAIYQHVEREEERAREGKEGNEIPPPPLASAFTHGLDSGKIFIEAAMSPDLYRALQGIPGIKRRHGLPIFTFIPPQLRPDVLHPPKTRELQFSVGHWVCVSRGTYKNDIAYVNKLEHWGGLQLLLVPRLSPPATPSVTPTNPQGTKRPRSGRSPRPSPALFDPNEVERIFQKAPRQTDKDSYRFGGQIFQHGLLLKIIDATSASCSPVFMPSDLAALFLRSGHPAILKSKLPSPSDWAFTAEDYVEINPDAPTSRQGRIKDVLPDSLEIELDDGAGRIVCDWYSVRKWVLVGDFVTVAAGMEVGRAGLVEAVFPTEVSVLEKVEEGEQKFWVQDTKVVKRFTVHKNSVFVTKEPENHALPSPSAEQERLSLRRDQVPWVGATVVITKQSHGRKGQLGVIQTVLHTQTTLSGLRVTVHFDNYNPGTRYEAELFDYDDVLEYTTKQELAKWKPPPNDLFRPHARQVRSYISSVSTPHNTTNAVDGSATPMPDPSEISSTTPAWNPSSWTPMWENRSPTPPLVVAPSSASSTLQHILLDPRLPRAKIQVALDSPLFQFAKTHIYVKDVDNIPTLCYSSRNMEHHLEPHWVTVIHPNVKLHKGLMLVIKGEHIGKFGLRICHHVVDKENMALVAIINRSEVSPPALTGEEVRFFADQLAIVEESKDEKEWNTACIASRRKAAKR